MSRSIAERTRDRSEVGFVGRRRELRQLLDAIQGDRTFVVYVQGVAGIGKSSLLRRLASDAGETGALVVTLDGRTLEPTDRGIRDAVALSIGVVGGNGRTGREPLAARLAALDRRIVLVGSRPEDHA